ncbi:serine/threonine-protein kinase [Chondromyces apiculatus]|uniref:Protein kinase domain-containing protein n=1 Tax=Chondromyces apiculatus DSM 436 TaxID=1192034 RepID=A0A017SWB0_9BACT|nr:serine/threonine-protein kinase [Chondromyces apiculatus]EYF00905.1 Hypothetical protein CAP_8922 [Chondromyces apiculatus DSM 436]
MSDGKRPASNGEAHDEIRQPVSIGRREASRVVAGRYRLKAQIGRGGSGEVWEAHDLVTGDDVALKFLNHSPNAHAARVRREVSALRLLQLPGVVRFMDEGVDADRAFLVMERLEGRPFPGGPSPSTWPAIASTAIALLETLARIHGAGVIHRDLKPGNILVSADGRPTVLDFGLSYVESPVHAREALTLEGDVLGTPAYLAPEQIVGDPVTPRTDLYAFGVMLYGALAGRLPHEAKDWMGLMRARMTQRPKPLQQLAAEVPGAVAEVAQRLLEVEPEARPRSAAEVLAMLRGQPVLTGIKLPWLGPEAPLAALREAVVRGRPVDVSGPRGMGRTRCLEEIAEEVSAQGRPVCWAGAGSLPFSSLAAITGEPEEQRDLRFAEVRARIERRLRDALAEGTVLLVDGLDRLDWASAHLIARCRAEGAVIRALDEAQAEGAVIRAPDEVEVEEQTGARGVESQPALRLLPLTEEALRGLFAGPDRLLHLREDAARELWRRTGGIPARVAHEVTAWVRGGLARWSAGRLVVGRDALDLLDTGLRVTPALLAQERMSAPRAPLLEEVLTWISLANHHVDVTLLAEVTGHLPWRVEAAIAELGARGALRVHGDGRIEPLSADRSDESWPWERRRAAHLALAGAMPTGAPGRLFHLLSAWDERDAQAAAAIARDAGEAARLLAQDGYVGKAVVPLAEGLRALRRLSPLPTEEVVALLSQWTELALAEATPRALDRVLYEICRVEPQTDALAHLEGLVRAALAVHVWTDRALAMAEAIAPSSSPGLERGRHAVRVSAARRCSLDREEAILSDIVRSTEASMDPDVRASVAGWLGRLRYRQGRFEEAAALQAEAARVARWTTVRIAAQLNGASALIEGFALGEAEALLRDALAQAQQCRHTLYEARAEWLLRAVAYRRGTAQQPDVELLEAFAQAGLSEMEGFVCLNEAVVAWRSGLGGMALDLAQRARKILAPLGEPWGELLASCLALVCGGELRDGEIAVLVGRGQRCPLPRTSAQVLALLAISGRWVPTGKVDLAAFSARIPAHAGDLRMEVLSPAEVIAALR